MHRSKLYGILIDCSEDTFDAGVDFWSGALGMDPARPDDPGDPYVPLKGDGSALHIMLQRVHDTSRFHLDIETDDIEAEVRRLEALGASRQAYIEHWWVMRAPTGHLFCVIPPQSEHSLDDATTWED